MLKSELLALLQNIPEDYEVVAGHLGPMHWAGVNNAYVDTAIIFPDDNEATYYNPDRTYVGDHDGHVTLPIVFIELGLYRNNKGAR